MTLLSFTQSSFPKVRRQRPGCKSGVRQAQSRSRFRRHVPNGLAECSAPEKPTRGQLQGQRHPARPPPRAQRCHGLALTMSPDLGLQHRKRRWAEGLQKATPVNPGREGAEDGLKTPEAGGTRAARSGALRAWGLREAAAARRPIWREHNSFPLGPALPPAPCTGPSTPPGEGGTLGP